MNAPPRSFRFLGGVIGTWAVLRIGFLIYTPPALRHLEPVLFPELHVESAASAEDTPAVTVPAGLADRHGTTAAGAAATKQRLPDASESYALALFAPYYSGSTPAKVMGARGEATPPATGFSPAFLIPREAAVAAPPPLPGAPPAAALRHWSGSAWAYVRSGSGGPGVATAGQLGGSQAGARLAWAPAPDRIPLALAARFSAPIEGSPGAEAAVGVEWQPAGVPLRLSVDRRIGLDAGGRDAWEVVVAGGVYAVPVGARLRLDGYLQAGVVGMRSWDMFTDGGARLGLPVTLGKGGTTVTLGGGVWGAAQPHVSRVDVGPSAVLRLPAGHAGITVAADWRFRVAGRARPRSGPSLTVASDF